MNIKEYRICLPFSMEEYKKGILYMVAKASTSENVSGVPMQILYNGPFENELGKGTMTHKVLYPSNRLPDWARKVLAKGAGQFQIEEKSWNMYPYIKTVYTCPLFDSEKFEIIVESRHAEDTGTTDNIHNLTSNQLKKRVVDFIDIATDTVDPRYYKKEEDPIHFKSKKTGRGPLKKGWEKTSKPVMCAYKLVTVNFNYWGLRNKVEKLLQDVIRNIYLTIHRQSFCWIDEWYDLSPEKIKVFEEKVKVNLNKISSSQRIEESKAPEKPSLAKRLLRSKL